MLQGPTLMSNLSMLVYICESMKLHEVAEYWQQVITMNEYQQRRFVNTIVETMVNVKGKKIALLGFAYKPDTSDCRQSPAIDIAEAMLAEGARLSIYDPQISAEVITAALGTHASPLQVGLFVLLLSPSHSTLQAGMPYMSWRHPFTIVASRCY